MGNDWKGELSKCFEDNRILENSIVEVRERFGHFCEFVAEPALEMFREELEKHKVGAKIHLIKEDSISLQVNFVKSSICQFQFVVSLPKNSIRLELKARVGARKNKKGIIETGEIPFFKGFSQTELLDLPKEDFLLELVRHYRDALFSSTVSAG